MGPALLLSHGIGERFDPMGPENSVAKRGPFGPSVSGLGLCWFFLGGPHRGQVIPQNASLWTGALKTQCFGTTLPEP